MRETPAEILDTKLRMQRAEAKFLERKTDPLAQSERDSLRLRTLFRQGATARPIYASKGRAGSSAYRPVSGPAYSLLTK